ncbi:DUF948 domain-containing protein [Limosilactobacillus caccae]|jgi:uncharacterized protein YoxC|uniref:DUF948 domain-containing protein n=1 Tax=Limosilactobacillus caccae TaxID=1926284 RepID=UPI00097080B4|nr:DUF948 domain-containing protein [Limosilactobacillus caccae]
MTFGQLAGLIAAIAFLILVIFACILLNQLSKTMKETNKSISTLTRDVHYLSQEMEDVLSNTNTLLDDINHKSEQLDPAIKAVAEVSQSVSDVNDALRKITEKSHERREKMQLDRGIFKMAGKTVMMGAFNKFRQRRKQKKGMTTDE